MNFIKRLLTKYRRLMKFALVGGIGVPINLGILYGLTESGLHYVVSAIIAIAVALTVYYLLNHYWTFRKEGNKSLIRGWCKYVVVSSIGDGIYLGLMVLFVEIAGIFYILSALMAIFMVFTVRYAVVSRFIWRKQNINKPESGSKP
jgi:dolichol-phosphate mannosyltransferase